MKVSMFACVIGLLMITFGFVADIILGEVYSAIVIGAVLFYGLWLLPRMIERYRQSS